MKEKTMNALAILLVACSVVMLVLLSFSLTKADLGCTVSEILNISAGGRDALSIKDGGDLRIYTPGDTSSASLFVDNDGELDTSGDFKADNIYLRDGGDWLLDESGIIKEDLLPYCSEEITSDVYDNGENQATGCSFDGYDGYYDISNLIPENVKVGISFGRGETGILAPTGGGNCYTDADGDTYYNAFAISVSDEVCDSLNGTTSYDSSTCVDCNDADSDMYPGRSPLSFEDGKDNDCDGSVDECDSSTCIKWHTTWLCTCTDGTNMYMDGGGCEVCSELFNHCPEMCASHNGVGSNSCGHTPGNPCCDSICDGWN